MTFGVPYSFVPGTKAKADEVNANFIDVLTKIEDTNLRIDETNSNAVSNSAEVTTKFENVEASIDQRANLDLSNISTTGKALFDAKANTSDIDGEWTSKVSEVISASTALSNSKAATYSLANYLPSDGSIYEVQLTCSGDCDLGQYYLGGSGYSSVVAILSRGNFSNTFNLIVGSARTITLTPTSLCSGTNKCSIRLSAYRKVR